MACRHETTITKISAIPVSNYGYGYIGTRWTPSSRDNFLTGPQRGWNTRSRWNWNWYKGKMRIVSILVMSNTARDEHLPCPPAAVALYLFAPGMVRFGIVGCKQRRCPGIKKGPPSHESAVLGGLGCHSPMSALKGWIRPRPNSSISTSLVRAPRPITNRWCLHCAAKSLTAPPPPYLF